MGSLLGDGCLVGAVAVVHLVEPEAGEVKGSPESEGEAEDEDLICPAVVEELAEESPPAFDLGVGVELGNDLGLSA